MSTTNDRDLVGYGRDRPRPLWSDRSPLALSLVLNYEQDGERTVLNHDARRRSISTSSAASKRAWASGT